MRLVRAAIELLDHAVKSTPFNETALPNHQITIDYVVNPGKIIYKGLSGLSNLQLTIPKSDYNFGLLIEMMVEDGDGHTYSDSSLLDIQTDIVRFGQDFLDFQKQCGLASKINIGKIKTLPQGVVHGGEALSPVDVTNVVKEIATQERPLEAVTLVKSLTSTYGGSAVMKAFSPSVIGQAELER